MTERWTEVEADFQEVYGIDLADAIYGGEPMSLRRLVVLTFALSQESRTMKSFREMAPAGWGRLEILTGLAVERLDQLIGTTVKAFGGKVRNKPPVIVPRPKRKPKREPQSVESALGKLDRMLVPAS